MGSTSQLQRGNFQHSLLNILNDCEHTASRLRHVVRCMMRHMTMQRPNAVILSREFNINGNTARHKHRIPKLTIVVWYFVPICCGDPELMTVKMNGMRIHADISEPNTHILPKSNR